MQEPNWLSIIADAASVAGLLLTGFVALQTRHIKQAVVRHARVPDTIRDLRDLSNELRRALADWPTLEQEANGALHRIESVLANVLPKLNGSEKKRIQEPLKLIERRTAFWGNWSRRTADERSEIQWQIYNLVLGATEALTQLDKDYVKRF